MVSHFKTEAESNSRAIGIIYKMSINFVPAASLHLTLRVLTRNDFPDGEELYNTAGRPNSLDGETTVAIIRR